jgi:hypothetical protein
MSLEEHRVAEKHRDSDQEDTQQDSQQLLSTREREFP